MKDEQVNLDNVKDYGLCPYCGKNEVRSSRPELAHGALYIEEDCGACGAAYQTTWNFEAVITDDENWHYAKEAATMISKMERYIRYRVCDIMERYIRYRVCDIDEWLIQRRVDCGQESGKT